MASLTVQDDCEVLRLVATSAHGRDFVRRRWSTIFFHRLVQAAGTAMASARSDSSTVFWLYLYRERARTY